MAGLDPAILLQLAALPWICALSDLGATRLERKRMAGSSPAMTRLESSNSTKVRSVTVKLSVNVNAIAQSKGWPVNPRIKSGDGDDVRAE
jgi:hypothetical protein